MGERLRGMAENVRLMQRGERGAERARDALESAGGTLERATAAFEPVVQRHDGRGRRTGARATAARKELDGSVPGSEAMTVRRWAEMQENRVLIGHLR